MMDVQKHSVHTLIFRSLKRTHDTFLSEQGNPPPPDYNGDKLKTSLKAKNEYGPIMHLVKEDDRNKEAHKVEDLEEDSLVSDVQTSGKPSSVVIPSTPPPSISQPKQQNSQALVVSNNQQALVPKKSPIMPRPNWHPPWKLFRVISGHLGWVRSVAIEPANQWFATGAGDRVIKIWDLASGKLKLSLTGHISSVRGLAVSTRQPYLFSCGEDKQVKCWDLEYNKVVRHYHGHLSACYGLDLHPTIDLLVSCGRDSVARVWDIRTKANIHTLSGHTNTVASVKCQATEPQVLTASHDSTIRLWDLVAGKTRATLTNHKKSVRALAVHPKLNMFASGSPDNIKEWRCPEGKFIQNLAGHNTIVNCLAVNSDGVLVSGGDNGTLHFWDWRTGYNFQRLQAPVQPGSMDSEAGIFACQFDHSGSRLITCEADKTIKIYKEDETATEDSYPVNWRPDILKRRRY